MAVQHSLRKKKKEQNAWFIKTFIKQIRKNCIKEEKGNIFKERRLKRKRFLLK